MVFMARQKNSHPEMRDEIERLKTELKECQNVKKYSEESYRKVRQELDDLKEKLDMDNKFKFGEKCIWMEDVKALQGQDRLKNEILILVDKGVIKCHDK